MTRAQMPGRHCYLADERARKAKEVLQGILIGLATLAGSAGFMAVYYWAIHHA